MWLFTALGVSAAAPPVSSSAVLAQLPDGEVKRQFVIDCTNCHQMEAARAYPGGKARTQAEWGAIVARMIGYAGATSGFPLMSADRNADSTAAWLARYLTAPPVEEPPLAPGTVQAAAEIREYLLPVPNDLPHDVAVDSSGTVLVTGMFSHAIYWLDTASGHFEAVPIPVANANPRAIEIAANGDWWVLLGNPQQVARFEPRSLRWSTFGAGMYAHSVALAADGRAWFNGHFTRDPEQIGYVKMDTGERVLLDAPRHPAMAARPGGPIPYELRLDPAGQVWMSELQGNRMLSFDPAGAVWSVYEMPRPVSAPRRFDVDVNGIVWIPEYAGNSLARLDPETGVVREYPLSRAGALPYIARVYGETVWIGSSGSDEVYAFDIPTARFTAYALPSRGAVIRHLVKHPGTGDLWLAYGGSPGIPARIARMRIR